LESLTLQFFDPASHARGRRILLFVIAALSSTIVLKIGQIQYLEVVNLGLIGALLVGFARQGYQVTWFRPYLRIASLYAGFVIVGLALAVASLRFDFYLADDLNILRYPVIISISRAVELMGNVGMMLYLANLFRHNLYWLQLTMRVYFWVGIGSAVYSLISYPIHVAGIASLGTYSDLNRFRGFYNEGGPYGLYVVSLILVGISLYRRGWERGVRMFVAFSLLSITLVMAQSKAAYGAVLLVVAINVFLAGSFSRRMVMLTGGAVVVAFVFQVTGAARLALLYQRESMMYERYSHIRAKDNNFVYGRVAGGFIVPRMIAAHPLTGIGWGNYGILRNNPEFRGASAFVSGADEPGLGLLGTAADFGLPLTFFLVICLFVPVFYAHRRKVPLYVVNLALWQPIVHIFGGQLNLTYPWVTTALALGLIYARNPEAIESRPELSLPNQQISGVEESSNGK
jgi:hypothetical protein